MLWCQWYSNMPLVYSAINLISDTLAVLYEDRSLLAETIPTIRRVSPIYWCATTNCRPSSFFFFKFLELFYFQPIFHTHRLSLHSFSGVKWSKYGLIQMGKKILMNFFRWNFDESLKCNRFKITLFIIILLARLSEPKLKWYFLIDWFRFGFFPLFKCFL